MKVWGTTDKILRRFILTFMDYALEFIEIEDIEQDLRGKKNLFIDILLDSLNEGIAGLDYVRYRQIIYRLGLYGLWITFQDPAYTDAAIDIIQRSVNKLVAHPELMVPRDPAEWHINEWWQKQR